MGRNGCTCLALLYVLIYTPSLVVRGRNVEDDLVVIICPAAQVVEDSDAVSKRQHIADEWRNDQVAVEVFENGAPIIGAGRGDLAIPCAVDAQFAPQNAGEILLADFKLTSDVAHENDFAESTGHLRCLEKRDRQSACFDAARHAFAGGGIENLFHRVALARIHGDTAHFLGKTELSRLDI